MIVSQFETCSGTRSFQYENYRDIGEALIAHHAKLLLQIVRLVVGRWAY